MGNFREQMDEARQTLHEEMSQPAKYFTTPYEEGVTEVLDITVRVHEKFQALGDLKGTSFNYAEIVSVTPRIVFLVEELTPARNFVVCTAQGVAYRIDNVLPADGLTQTATVAKMRVSETTGFPVPE